METEFWIESLEFKNHLNVNLKNNSIVVFVGPNNSGKSKTLKEIVELSKGHKINNLILNSLKISASGNSKDFLKRIEHRNNNGTFLYNESDHNAGMHGSNLEQYWKDLVSGSQTSSMGISNFFLKYMDTVKRLNLINPAENIDFINEMRSHPIHALKENGEKELEFSKYFNEAFGQEVIVNHAAGKKIPLHVGIRPNVTVEKDRVSIDYQKELRKLPLLHEQGDGMKSFAGVFLSLFAENFTINLIDEPEAFLHPPQARLLGQMISQKLGKDKQIFIATHSEHLLKGLLESAIDRLIFIRIDRTKNNNILKLLDNNDIQKIWNDSILRHSNVLDGLFHKKVVLVESDSDCRFYSAITNALVEEKQLPSPDILFIQSGGKHRFPVVIKSLNKLEVPLTIIGDFDLYHDVTPIKTIWEIFNGDWEIIKNDFNKVKKAIDEKRPELESEKLFEEITTVFDSFNEKIVPERKIKEIQSLLKKSSPWSQAKSSGKAYLPAGEVTLAFNRLQECFKEKGFYILELGEIESFDKSIGGHGPKWVNTVLEKDIISNPNLVDAKKFILENILNISN